jgi:cell division protein FtsZ
MFKPRIKLIGVGGAGCNTVSRLARNVLKEIEIFAVNTDAQSLKNNFCHNRVLIGKKTTEGLGTGMDWKLGQKAAEEDKKELKEILKGAEIIFLTAGLGGGTGTSAISILGNLAKELNILTIAVVTLPFSFEGISRKKLAQMGLKNLQENVDAFLVIPNDRILKLINKDTSIEDAFMKIDRVLLKALEGIFELLSSSGIINLDFADIEEILKNSGKVLFGQGKASGEQRAIAAVSRALQSPLLDLSPKNAKGILFNICGEDVTLAEVNSIANFIKKIADKKTKILFGISEDGGLNKGEIKVNLIASGIE